ncbi:hypothetical protein SAMN02745115_01682 [[Eubacterium] yurii]|nr:hypothetical protein SAMN02745115_01682 [[Eubacterium] yurii]
MKNISKFTKKIFALSLVGILTVGVFTANADANLKVNHKDREGLKALILQSGNSKIAEKLLDKNGKQSATGRYANTTPDGKVKWNVENEYKISFTDAEGISKNITLDGKKVSFPMKFSVLGQKYAEFADVDFSKLNKDMIPIIVENTKNNMKMTIIDSVDKEDNTLIDMGYKQKSLMVDFYEEGKNMIGVTIDTNDKKIMGFFSGGAGISKRELKVNGIGVGNTFNEMYAKFGTPVRVQKIKMEKSVYTIVTYVYVDEKGNMWDAYFANKDKIYINKKYVKTKPNVITEVLITCNTNSK